MIFHSAFPTYPKSAISEIHNRIGKEISKRKIKFQIDQMKEKGEIFSEGEKDGADILLTKKREIIKIC